MSLTGRHERGPRNRPFTQSKRTLFTLPSARAKLTRRTCVRRASRAPRSSTGPVELSNGEDSGPTPVTGCLGKGSLTVKGPEGTLRVAEMLRISLEGSSVTRRTHRTVRSERVRVASMAPRGKVFFSMFPRIKNKRKGIPEARSSQGAARVVLSSRTASVHAGTWTPAARGNTAAETRGRRPGRGSFWPPRPASLPRAFCIFQRLRSRFAFYRKPVCHGAVLSFRREGKPERRKFSRL